MISEKNDRVVGSSSSSKPGSASQSNGKSHEKTYYCLRYDNVHFACLSHNAESRISASLILLFELEYMKRLQWNGWNSVAVMTSVNSSMFTGLISTISNIMKWGTSIIS